MKLGDLMNPEQHALEVLDMFLHKQCDLERTKFAYSQPEVFESVKMARDAHKKQIAKKANKIIYSKHMDARMGICPVCKSNEVYEWNVYCSKCGNKLDWTVEE